MNATMVRTQITYLEDWRSAFQQSLLDSKLSENTIKNYMQDMTVFARWFEEANPGKPFNPGLISSWDIRAFREWELDVKRVSAGTWNLRRASLFKLCSWLERNGIDLHFNIRDIPIAKEEPKSPDWLTENEFNALVRAAEMQIRTANTLARKVRATRDWALMAVMVFGALRESEAADLRLADLSMSERRGRIFIQRGKGDKSREVPLNAEARRAISAWLEVRGTEPGPLFSDEHGRAISGRAIQKRIAELGKAARIDHIHPHRLRHTCLKRMIDAGRPLTEAQLIAGHSSIQSTARYVMPGWEDLEAAVEAGTLGRMVGKSI
jgi:integrase